MSCNYYRVMPEPPRPEVFGFKKVTQEELGNIVSRLSRPTYNSRVHTVEAHKAHNYRKIHSAPPPRTPTVCSRRRLSTPNPNSRRMTEQELRRFLRRIQRPTRAHIRSRRDYRPEEDDGIMAGDDFATFNAVEHKRRPLTATERKKAFFMLSRPTTASKAKSSVECAFCPSNEEELKANRNLDLPFKYPHAPEVRLVTPGEASSIVSRVSSPTRASLRGGGPPCYRAFPDYDAVRGQHPSLPLVSGLARTPKVSQIVNRLHYGATKRIVMVVREVEAGDSEEEEREEAQRRNWDRRESRGTSSEDDRGKLRRAAPSARMHHRRNVTGTQNGRRSYHGYHAAATPITAWS
ncbi:hypothetical protein EGW08_008250 [Elysia chlorotica]|uniref:Uncharacterized protein n=1 Tax=Elysia chlorotica TaxID=188477 RepID=A0A3S0ZPS4_ELYCH|nr:hypothetical protein EGW08_008250 [Elysia chlorotica]